ncbi:MAG TPA: efflux transporter outer membrane subunit [Burkholderiales bacterium]|jgi:NodT family efflux transporter outer membrane factor (OMF) lipoprotein|nr:efflux transporter outer membrane subunit [Burkholderiales bacterium]
MRRLSVLGLALLAACADPGGITHRSAMVGASSLEVDKSLSHENMEAAWPELDWWKRFGDPQLDALEEEGLAGSPTIRLARSRVDQALAAAQVAGAVRKPQVNASGDVTRQRFSENAIFPPPIGGSTFTTTEVALNADYELDLWGKNRAAYDAALGRSQAAEADAFTSRLVLSAALAGAYVQLARAYEQLDLAHRALEDREKVQALTNDRVRAGLDSRLELKQVETSIPAARARVAQVEEEIALARNQIAALLGKGPDRGLALERPTLRMAGVALPSRVPADLLGRRPDVVASRLRAEAASRQVAAQKAEFYPDVNLSALVGLQSVTLSHLLDPASAIPSIGAAVRLPIFDGGRLRGALAQRNAEYDAAVEQYNQTLADALREVVDQLTSLRSVNAQRTEVESALASAEEAYALAVTRYKAGLGSLLQVLTAEMAVLEQRNLRADLQSRELALSIDLMRALGGGYEAKVAMQ